MPCKSHKFYRASDEKAPKFRRGRNEDEFPKRHGKGKGKKRRMMMDEDME